MPFTSATPRHALFDPDAVQPIPASYVKDEPSKSDDSTWPAQTPAAPLLSHPQTLPSSSTPLPQLGRMATADTRVPGSTAPQNQTVAVPRVRKRPPPLAHVKDEPMQNAGGTGHQSTQPAQTGSKQTSDPCIPPVPQGLSGSGASKDAPMSFLDSPPPS